jgi:hypothetical protein
VDSGGVLLHRVGNQAGTPCSVVGNLLGGRPDWAVRRLGISSGHRFGGQNLEQLLRVRGAPMGMLIFWLVFNVAIAALSGYVGVMVHRGMKAGLAVTLGVSADSGCSV